MNKPRRKSFITQKGYGKTTKMFYYPLEEEDLNLEPFYLVKTMRQVQVEVLKMIEFCSGYGDKSYEKGIHSLDIDLANLLVRCGAARFILPKKTVLAAKESRH